MSATIASYTNFSAELARVEAATTIERTWMEEAGAELFEDDEAILEAVRAERLVRVADSLGFVLRPKLSLWHPGRSDPRDEHHYSPPFALPTTRLAVEAIGQLWFEQVGTEYALCVSSLVRSRRYQQELVDRGGVLAVPLSSHAAGWSADIPRDFYRSRPGGLLEPVNKRQPNYDAVEMNQLNAILTDVVGRIGGVNVVEENIGTTNACIHMCVQPSQGLEVN